MAVTFTPILPANADPTPIFGDRQIILGSLTFSGNYTTGGDALSFVAQLTQSGVGIADYVGINPIAGYVFAYNYANGTLQVYDTGASSGAALAELAAGAYPGAITAVNPRFVVIGR